MVRRVYLALSLWFSPDLLSAAVNTDGLQEGLENKTAILSSGDSNIIIFF